MDFSDPALPAIGSVIPGRQGVEVVSASYHDSGQRLFLATADNRLQVVDCVNGQVDGPALRFEREQMHTVEATHHEHSVLFAGKGSPAHAVGQRNAVNYYSVYDNKILRKFPGHSDKVTTISMCPTDDSFLTSSLDRTVRLWTLGSAGCVAEMKLPEETEKSPLAMFDSTGLVFAVAAAMSQGRGHYLHLYDARNYSAGAFAELKVTQEDLETALQSHVNATPDLAKTLATADWTSMHFNVSGNQILIGATMGMCILLDGFEGSVQRVLQSATKSTDRAAVVCYTPDDRTILKGNEDGTIACWDVSMGSVTKVLSGHSDPVSCVVVNPKYGQIASSCSQTILWSW